MRKTLHHSLVIMFYYFIVPNSFAQQSKIDSFLLLLKTAKEDTTHCKYLNVLSNEYRIAGNYDTAKFYCNLALDLSKKINYKYGSAQSYNVIGAINWQMGNYDIALENYTISLKLRKEIGDKNGIASSYNNIGNNYVVQGKFEEAVENYTASMKIREEIGDKQGSLQFIITWELSTKSRGIMINLLKAISVH